MRRVDPFLLQLQEQIKEQTKKWEVGLGSISRSVEALKKAKVIADIWGYDSCVLLMKFLGREDLAMDLTRARIGITGLAFEPFIMVVMTGKTENHSYSQGNTYLIIDAKERYGLGVDGEVGNHIIPDIKYLRAAKDEEIDTFFLNLTEEALYKILKIETIGQQFASFLMEEDAKKVGTSD